MIDFSEVGQIEKTPAVYAEDGSVTTPATYLAGWHVNSTESHPDLKKYEIQVDNPVRVYSGADTIFMRFTSKKAFDAVMAPFYEE